MAKLRYAQQIKKFIEENIMWYFSWMLGVLLAVSLGIINVMWYEMEQHVDNVSKDQGSDEQS